ncbi:MAG: RloB family protein [Gammaproteobacteria bacterium]|nr:RloB family protein [Gammaproteobacteria bacterium]
MVRRRGKTSLDTRRRPAYRNERERVLIVTEGSKTEPTYFRSLIRELGITANKVIVSGEGGSAPINVVKDAESHLANDVDFEHVFLVFDRDRHPTYGDAIEKARKLKPKNAPRNQSIEVIPSIPSFEIWYFCHVSNERKPYPTGKGFGSPAQNLIRDLKNSHSCFANYKKGRCDEFYDELKPMREDACRRAEKFLEEAQKEGEQEFYENPSTRVHIIVRRLQAISENQS